MLRRSFSLAMIFIATAVAGGVAKGEQTYLLRYKLTPGQQLTYRVVHSAKTQVKINETEEASQVHTTSVRGWDVKEVAENGDVTFDHVIRSVVMTQQTGDAEEIRWDSTTDQRVPAQFKMVAEKIGQVIDTIRINDRGEVLERTGKDFSGLGMGDITLPLPEEQIAVGGQWSVPRDVRVKNSSGNLKVIKIRELYTLDKVQASVATITVRSEPLTPISDQRVQSQLVQQLSDGTIKFDMDAGRVMNRRLEWDDDVVGFQGPASNMEYHARLTEDWVEQAPQTASLNAPRVD